MDTNLPNVRAVPYEHTCILFLCKVSVYVSICWTTCELAYIFLHAASSNFANLWFSSKWFEYDYGMIVYNISLVYVHKQWSNANASPRQISHNEMNYNEFKVLFAVRQMVESSVLYDICILT